MSDFSIISNLQELMFHNSMPTFEEFKNETLKGIFVPEEDMFYIFVFIFQMQKHPGKCSLIPAMKEQFEEAAKNIERKHNDPDHLAEYIRNLRTRSDLSMEEAVKSLKERTERDLGSNIEKITGKPPGPGFSSFVAAMAYDIIYDEDVDNDSYLNDEFLIADDALNYAIEESERQRSLQQ